MAFIIFTIVFIALWGFISPFTPVPEWWEKHVGPYPGLVILTIMVNIAVAVILMYYFPCE